MENEPRGRIAAGIAWRNGDGKYFYQKDKGPASEFWRHLQSSAVLPEILASPIVIIHTRQPTKGSPDKEENNHPVVKSPWLVVHNGIIHNDDAIFAKYNEPRYAEVDSAALPVVLSQGTTLAESAMKLAETGGSASIAAINVQFPNSLLLYRNGPEFSLFCSGHGLFVFSSEKDIRSVLQGPVIIANELSLYAQTVMPDDHALILSLSPSADMLVKVPRQPIWHRTVPDAVSISGKFTWVAGRPGKPEPLFGVLRLYKNPLSIRLSVIEKEATTANKFPWEFLTPYGRWVFYKNGTNLIRVFSPHKRVRHWIKSDPAGLIEWWDSAESTNKCLLNDFADLEEITVPRDNGLGPYQQIVYLCPWCGIPGLGWQWRQYNRKCEFCEIVSSPPASEKTWGLWK